MTVTQTQTSATRKRSSAVGKSSAAKKTKSDMDTLKLPPIKQSEQEPEMSKSERHKCPHHPQGVINKGSSPCLLSEYANRYTKHPMEPTKSMKPAPEPMANKGPLADETTHRKDYIPHPLEKPHVHQPDQYKTPDGEFDHLTNYTKDYIKRPIERTQPIKRDDRKKVPGKFEGTPTYTHDYRKWSASRREPIVRDHGYRPSSQPFEGLPTYVRDYIKHPHQMTRSLKPAETARASDQPFDDRTGYRDEYIKHPMQPREQQDKKAWEPNPNKLDGLSSYMKEYTPKRGGPADSCKPSNAGYQSNAPFEDDTTNRRDYIQHKTERPYQHAPDQYVKPDGEMDTLTTHNRDYTPKPLEKPKAYKPAERKKVPGKFDDNTNYKHDYRRWGPQERPQITMRPDYVPNDAPFEGLPTYVRDYIKHPHQMTRSLKPAETARASDQPFDDRTGYRDEYIKHPMQPREQKEKRNWEPNPNKLDGLSSYMKEYTPKRGGPSDSCKPSNAGYQSNAPFEDDTTNRRDYVPHKTERPYQHAPDQYVKPDGQMDTLTTHNRDYTPKPLEKPKAYRPAERKKVPGKFDDSTNYKHDYRKWGPQERPQITMRPDYVPNDAPFEGLPTYTKDYTKKPIDTRRSMKPADEGHRSGAPFEGDTEYREEFTKKAAPPCPAGVIERGGSAGFVYKEQDPRGHKWYEQGTTYQDLNAKNTMGMNQNQLNKQMTALAVA